MISIIEIFETESLAQKINFGSNAQQGASYGQRISNWWDGVKSAQGSTARALHDHPSNLLRGNITTADNHTTQPEDSSVTE